MSIDENREDFEPTLWSEKPGLDLKQVWFAGVHSDVGGGYREQGLSHCAIHWMTMEAKGFGLLFEPHLVKSIKPNACDKQHNERKGIYRARGELIRTITGPLHMSVKHRWEKNADNYRTKSRALKTLIEANGYNWSQIELVG